MKRYEIVCPECGEILEDKNRDSKKAKTILRNLYLFGEIEDVIVQEIIEDILYLEYKDQNKPINLYINSDGGYVSSGFALIDVIKNVKCPIRTIALGEVCSMASAIFISGTKGYREIAKNAWLMFHPITTGTREDYLKFQKSRVLQAEQLEQQYDKIILANSNIPESEYKKAKDTELWLPAKKVIEYNIADKYFERC